MKTIVSMTSWPPRISHAAKAAVLSKEAFNGK